MDIVVLEWKAHNTVHWPFRSSPSTNEFLAFANPSCCAWEILRAYITFAVCFDLFHLKTDNLVSLASCSYSFESHIRDNPHSQCLTIGHVFMEFATRICTCWQPINLFPSPINHGTVTRPQKAKECFQSICLLFYWLVQEHCRVLCTDLMDHCCCIKSNFQLHCAPCLFEQHKYTLFWTEASQKLLDAMPCGHWNFNEC